jgi:hypothetical protein
MKKLTLLLMFVLIGFGMLQTAYGAVTAPPTIQQMATDQAANSGQAGTGLTNARIAISPYAQVVANSSYTFIGISHPSLATAHTSIGVAVEVLDMVTVPDTVQGAAAIFTVSAGETHRVFVVNQSHSTINLSNSAFTDSQTHLITTSDDSQFGSIKVTGIGTLPTLAHTDAKRAGGKYITGATATIKRWDNVSQLAMWGVVYQSTNGAGFALEFIGDMHDSSASGSVHHGGDLGVGHYSKSEGQCDTRAAAGRSCIATGKGRGIN